MSGGVDSSVAAALLQRQGYQVLGAMLDLRSDAGEDDSALQSAREVAQRLDIPFEILDRRGEFAERVVTPMVKAYAAGETPNPCVGCNATIKFAELLRYADSVGAELVASGHYARRRGAAELWRGRDAAKDQSYFLWRISRAELARLRFPLGESSKAAVRQLALALGLPSARRRESQNICFVKGKFKDFLASRLEARPGPLLDLASGEVIGEHAGAAFYTVGQRRGLGLWRSHLERYVVEVRPASNEVVVGPREAVLWRGLEAEGLNLLADAGELEGEVSAQVRYRARAQKARLSSLDLEKGVLSLVFEEPQFAITPGQTLALYRGERLLAGAFIKRAMCSLWEEHVTIGGS